MSKVLSYEKKNTWIDALSGVSKLIFFLLWTLTSMLTYDTRVLLAMVIVSLIVFKAAKVKWSQVGSVFVVIMFFLVLNIICVYILAPYQGCELYESRTDLFTIVGNYVITKEQLLYEFNMILKYCTVVPAVFMFIVTTNPSEFAASLNKIGISYNAGYAIAIALRYIPDVQKDFKNIKNAQEARGIEMSSKAGIIDRIKSISSIIFPLLFTSIDRIDVVSNAMELRGYGKHPKRSWYSARKLKRNDYLLIIFSVAASILALVITFYDGNRFKW